MGWRILYIEDAISVKLYLDNVMIVKSTGNLTVPLADIHTLIVDNINLTITIPLINKCAEYNINFVICSIEHMPNALIYPFAGNFQQPMIFKKQISWSEETKSLLHMMIIRNKISNQIDLLKHLNRKQDTIEKLFTFYDEVTPSDPGNREGLAAKMYFRELFGERFKRFEDDVVNAGLNYGYSILRSQISKTLIAKGLNPSLGIIHKGYNNQFNLSDDIIEVFRPIIDEYVVKNMAESILLTRENKLQLISITTKNVMINKTSQTIFNAISIYIDKIMEAFESNDVSKYAFIYLEYGL